MQCMKIFIAYLFLLVHCIRKAIHSPLVMTLKRKERYHCTYSSGFFRSCIIVNIKTHLWSHFPHSYAKNIQILFSESGTDTPWPLAKNYILCGKNSITHLYSFIKNIMIIKEVIIITIITVSITSKETMKISKLCWKNPLSCIESKKHPPTLKKGRGFAS